LFEATPHTSMLGTVDAYEVPVETVVVRVVVADVDDEQLAPLPEYCFRQVAGSQ